MADSAGNFKATGVKVCICEICTSKGGGIPLLKDVDELCPAEISVSTVATLKDLCSNGPCLLVQPKGTKQSNGQFSWPQPVSFTGIKSFKNIEAILKKDVGMKISSLQQKLGVLKFEARRSSKDKDAFQASVQKAFKVLGGESSAFSQDPVSSAQLLVLRATGFLGWDVKAAMADARKAIELVPTCAPAHAALASGYEVNGFWPEALKSINTAIDSAVGDGARGFDRQEANRLKERIEKKIDEESGAKKKAEEAKKKALEAKKKAEEDAAAKKAEEDAAAKKAEEDAAAKKAEEEARAKKSAEEAEAKRKAQKEAERANQKKPSPMADAKREATARKRGSQMRSNKDAAAQAEAVRRAMEEEERRARQEEEEEQRAREEEEETRRRAAEEERHRKEAEEKQQQEAARKLAQEKLKEEEEEVARAKAGEEEAARLKAEDQARLLAEEEDKRKAEEEARRAAEEAIARAEAERARLRVVPFNPTNWLFNFACCQRSSKADDAIGDAPRSYN